ncbi:alkylation response protein AidB-like acyl-CoA dehydrogenase [Bradyrhizobium sp. RT6a]
MWARYAELGLLRLPFSEAHDGSGGGAVGMMIIMEAFGKALILPYLATVVLAGSILRHGASDPQKAELISAIAGGRMKLAFAYGEPRSRYDLFHVETRARRDDDGWLLSGTNGLILHGDGADKIVVSARTAGGSREKDGIGFFLVGREAQGLMRCGYRTQDGVRATEDTLENVRVDVIGDPAGAFHVILRVAEEAVAALCADGVGCFDKMQSTTLDYLKRRQQFGKTIGPFQMLQQAVDMFVKLEKSRSMAMYATIMAAEDDATERARAISAAKSQIGQSAKAISQQSIQLHGGVGMTIGHYFKQVTMIDSLLGDADHHLRRLASLAGLISDQENEQKAR